MGGSTPLRAIKIAIIMSIFKEPLNQSPKGDSSPRGRAQRVKKVAIVKMQVLAIGVDLQMKS